MFLKSGWELPILLRIIICECCGFVFALCRACYRGQRYCCEKCRKAGYLERRREAQRRYRQTEQGKAAHRAYEKFNRAKEKLKTIATNTVTRCCRMVMSVVKRVNGDIFAQNGICELCSVPGTIVDQFPRRR